MEFAEKLGPKYVFGRKIARRRNYEARTGRLILKRPGFMGRARSARPENGRKVENGRKMLVVLRGAEAQKNENISFLVSGRFPAERTSRAP